jgi:hypothetical protein
MRTGSTTLASLGAAVLFVSACAGSGEGERIDGQSAAIEQRASRSEYPEGTQISVNGDDCPVAFIAAPSPDNEAVTVTFSENLLTPTRTSARCHIGIDYTFPAGWRFRRPSAVARGYQFLGAGQTSVWAVRSRLGSGDWVARPLITQGPADDNFIVDVASGEDLGEDATECGATSAHIELDVIGSLFGFHLADALGTVDSVDTEIDWEKCP